MDQSVRLLRIIRFGTFEVDTQTGELHKEGQKIRLQEQPLQILLLLLERPGEVVTREELRQKLWPADTFVDFEAGLNTAVKKLRDALEDSADKPRFVETLPRRGYRFLGVVSDSLQSRLQPRRLGRYRVEEQIGAGGMGEVYRGRDDHLERDVALKVLPAGALADEAARKRFRKEALALSKLNHPNIQTVFDFDTQDGVDYLVLEYIPGVTLDEKLVAGALEEKEIVALATQLAEALAAAHERGVLHRDLKPKNLRVTPDGQLKILDFGLAKLLRPATDATATASLSETQGLVGTLPYMAPEQLRGEKADARSDLYAAGLVLYEMATGQRAFREELAPRLTDAILHQALVPPRVVNSRISPELERLIVKCLEKQPENRYQSARELGADLRRLGGLAPAPTVTPAAPSGVLWRRTMLAVSFTVVALSAIGVGYWLTRPPALPFEERGWVLIGQFENLTGDDVLSGALEYALERELSNSQFVNVVPRERINDTLGLMKKPLDTRIDATVGREICLRDGGIRTLITGRVEKLDTTYVLSASLVEPGRGVSVGSFSEEAEGQKEVLPALRRLSRHVREALGEKLGLIQASEQKLEKVTTPSLRASKLFTQADAVIGYENNALAEELLRQAVAEDPEFASGYMHLAYAIANQGRPRKESLPYAEKALKLSDGASERERYFIVASYYGMSGQPEKAMAAFDALLRLYPDYYWANTNKRFLLYRQRRYQEANRYRVREAQLRPNSFITNLHTASHLIRWGSHPFEAQPYVQRTLQLASPEAARNDAPSFAWLELFPAREHWLEGDLEKAVQEATRLSQQLGSRSGRERSLLAYNLRQFYLTLGKVQAAQELSQDLDARLAIAFARDNHPALRDSLRQALASGVEAVGPFEMILCARLGMLPEAEKALAIVEKRDFGAPWLRKNDIEQENLTEGIRKVARGELELARGRTAEALRLLEEGFTPIPPHGFTTYFLGAESLAQAYEQQGNLGQAVDVLRKAGEEKRRAVYYGGPSTLLWMRIQLRLAGLYRNQGGESQAQEIEAELRKLLVYADPDYPILSQLKRRSTAKPGRQE